MGNMSLHISDWSLQGLPALCETEMGGTDDREVILFLPKLTLE